MYMTCFLLDLNHFLRVGKHQQYHLAAILEPITLNCLELLFLLQNASVTNIPSITFTKQAINIKISFPVKCLGNKK